MSSSLVLQRITKKNYRMRHFLDLSWNKMLWILKPEIPIIIGWFLTLAICLKFCICDFFPFKYFEHKYVIFFIITWWLMVDVIDRFKIHIPNNFLWYVFSEGMTDTLDCFWCSVYKVVKSISNFKLSHILWLS